MSDSILGVISLNSVGGGDSAEDKGPKQIWNKGETLILKEGNSVLISMLFPLLLTSISSTPTSRLTLKIG